MTDQDKKIEGNHLFYLTNPLPCPYLPGHLERKIFTELRGDDSTELHNFLSKIGFRRSHGIAYIPACPNCSACIPVRIVLKDFSLSKTQRRIRNKNKNLIITRKPIEATAEQYALFVRYQEERHPYSDMAHMNFDDYATMIEETPIATDLYEMRDENGVLHAVLLTDEMDDGLSAVYSFFDPDDASRSLGTYCIIWLTEETRVRDLPYVYLGYWVKNSPKMAYKESFKPLEFFSENGWEPLDIETEKAKDTTGNCPGRDFSFLEKEE